jgi:hypothetical protein
MAEIGCQVGQGHKHKSALRQAWMGDLQARQLQHLVIVEQDIQVDQARPVTDTRLAA